MSSTELPTHVSAGPFTCVFAGLFACTDIIRVLRSTPADNTVVSSMKERRNAALQPVWRGVHAQATLVGFSP
jgi:hypothetical protein